MHSKTIIMVLAATTPCLSFAQGSESYRCSYGDLQRRVEIYTDPGVSVPCEVHYYKDTEAPGERQVLWHASKDAAYCEQKTAEFIGKLLDWGWTCGQNEDAAGSAKPATDAEPESEPEAEPTPPETVDEPPFIEDAEMGDEP